MYARTYIEPIEATCVVEETTLYIYTHAASAHLAIARLMLEKKNFNAGSRCVFILFYTSSERGIQPRPEHLRRDVAQRDCSRCSGFFFLSAIRFYDTAIFLTSPPALDEQKRNSSPPEHRNS
jgi:hypothetical protein